MTLARYLSANGIPHAEFARRIGVSGSAVWRWAHGERTPGLGAALLIERATGGAVKATSFLPRRRHKKTVRPSEAPVPPSLES